MFQYIADFDPGELIDLPIASLYERFGGPVILRLAGDKRPPLLLSTLLHGNEWTGYHALQRYLKEYEGLRLPRETFVLLGNVEAAQSNTRFLDGQNDFNRIWSEKQSSFWSEALNRIDFKNLFACVDMHNNTGKSPHYAIVSKHDPKHYNLAKMFGPRLIHLQKPQSALSIYLSQFIPAITLECGLSDERDGIDHTLAFLNKLYAIENTMEQSNEPVELYETLASMHVPEGKSFSFSENDADADICFTSGISELNFMSCEKGTKLARSAKNVNLELRSCQINQDPVEHLTTFTGQDICISESLVPCMLTEDRDAIRKDCFGYLMRRIH